MRSCAKFLSRRKLYCLALLQLDELKFPLSKTGVAQGMLSVAGVPQPVLCVRSCGPNTSRAVAAIPVVVAPLGGYLAINWTSGESGRTCCANDTNAGSS